MSLPDIQAWIDRLDAAQHFAEVGDSMLLRQRLAGESVVTPAAYVSAIGDEAQRQALNLAARHTVVSTLAVVVVVTNFGHAQQAGDYGLRMAREAAFTQLAGWVPAGYAMPAEWQGGTKLSALDSNLIVWQDSYTIAFVM